MRGNLYVGRHPLTGLPLQPPASRWRFAGSVALGLLCGAVMVAAALMFAAACTASVP